MVNLTGGLQGHGTALLNALTSLLSRSRMGRANVAKCVRISAHAAVRPATLFCASPPCEL